MRNNIDQPEQSLASKMAVARLAIDKASGVQMKTVSEALDGAVQTIRDIITTTIAAIDIGIGGEPTPEDLQRLHELRSLLEDLP